jgi:outer membrane protein OmpA-like peptidoglycan-associated protein
MLTLSGEVFEEDLRSSMIEVAQRASRDGRVSEVVDSLTVVGGALPEGFEEIAGRVAEVASLCIAGNAWLTEKTFSVDCEITRAMEPEVRRLVELPLLGASLGDVRLRRLVERPLLGASLGDVRLVVAEELERCGTELAALQQDDRIEFQSGSAMIAPDATAHLSRIADLTNRCPGVVRVEGHTDNTGVQDSNHILSLARAHALRDALVSRGVPLARFHLVALGETNPVANNNTAEGRARNRRAEVRIVFDAN